MPHAIHRPTLLSALAFLGLALPWLNPFSPGPTPNVVPWLAALAGFAVMLPWLARARPAQLAALAASAWLLVALLSALMGLLQYFGATGALEPWVNSTNLGEAYANLRQRNQFATLTNIGLAALWWWLAQGPVTSATGDGAARSSFLGWRTLAPLAAAALLALGNAASSSRTGMVQLLLLTLLAGVWRASGWRRPAVRRVLLMAVLAYAVGAVVLPLLLGQDLHASGMLARLQQGDPHCASRLTLWGNVLHLIAQRPVFGWGWGELDYAHFITLYPGRRFCDILDNAHNLPLHLAVELGLPLALALCGTGLWLTLRAKPWRELDATRQLAWSVLALILLHSLLEYPLWYGPFQVAFGLSLWLLWRHAAPSSPQRFKIFEPLAPVLSSLVAILIIVFVAYAAWDYQRVSQFYLSPKMRAEAYRAQPLAKIQSSWLFQDQLRFAELTTTPLTAANAAHLHQLALDLLHFSPEPRVIEKLIDSATLLGRLEEAQFYRLRYQAAFPDRQAVPAH
ncbi:Wzy polymerase domain-containing protein [Rhodoferax ferrireducens]|uniref:Wzy polymerase domain-containing protein n=1 Tax=Rhodoferax ferrireducens TaxID=192843 RepID=UPI00298DF552|nr:Wzy polymerase domain-containing protein [Rhodoferax ferrireducens]WPC66775.1 Wzy polymerase domain-containing protein [Rhodoferax ferrireducens]